VNYNKHGNLENYYWEQLLLFHPFTTWKESQLGKHKSWHDAYLACENSINHAHSKFIFKFQKQTQGLQNWNDIELHAHKLAEINSKSIWMDKFDNVEKFINSLHPITNYIGIEHYDIGCEFHIKIQCFLSTIPCVIYQKNKNLKI